MILVKAAKIKSAILGNIIDRPRQALIRVKNDKQDMDLLVKILAVDKINATFEFDSINSILDGRYNLNESKLYLERIGEVCGARIIMTGDLGSNCGLIASLFDAVRNNDTVRATNIISSFSKSSEDNVIDAKIIDEIRKALAEDLAMQSVVDWFDVQNVEHLKAYHHWSTKGDWPDNFPPKHVGFYANWHTKLATKIATQMVAASLLLADAPAIEEADEAGIAMGV